MVTYGSIVCSTLAIAFDLFVIARLVCHTELSKCTKKYASRRIGLLHSTNTYIHLLGILLMLLFMSIQTLDGDYNDPYGKPPPWYCHLFPYLMSLFAAGVYGSCFLQALFRLWRIVMPNRAVFQSLSFHLHLIIAHWLVIGLLLLPIYSRSIYLPADYFCFTPFDDRWAAAYIALVTAVVPVAGIVILYVKIVVHVKRQPRRNKQWRRTQRDLGVIRRILFLMMIILQTSGSGIILWISTFFDQRLHAVFYRLLRLLIILCMIVCSVTLLMTSPQLKRALRTTAKKNRSQQQADVTADEPTPFETLLLSD